MRGDGWLWPGSKDSTESGHGCLQELATSLLSGWAGGAQRGAGQVGLAAAALPLEEVQHVGVVEEVSLDGQRHRGLLAVVVRGDWLATHTAAELPSTAGKELAPAKVR